MSQLVIGLTGGIGSGKTSVSDAFSEYGIVVIDADVVSREVVEPGQPALNAIVDKFGDNILTASGTLDRAKLREIVFKNEADKQWLNNLLHPLIRERMQSQLHNADSIYCILSAPLLVENNMQNMVDRVLVVDVPESLQITRTSQRDNQQPQQVQNIINAQANRQQRLDAADDVIDNSGDLKSLKKQVEILHAQYLHQLKS